MIKWRLAEAIQTLLDEVNYAFPDRSKNSDGGIGNAEHASRNSDHNPWIKDSDGVGVVTAYDFTHDPDSGLHSEMLAEDLIRTRDPRIKYIISNRKICSGPQGIYPWRWRTYKGPNPHNHHVHVSVEDEAALYDSQMQWMGAFTLPRDSMPTPAVARLPVLRKGDTGKSVRVLQEGLNNHGFSLKLDSAFGPATEKAVRAFQKSEGLEADGVVGAYTWERIV